MKNKIFMRPTLQKGSVKKPKDEKARKRNTIINFRVTPEEKERIDARILMTGMDKAEFFIVMLTVREFDEKGSWQQKTKSVYANARDSEGRAIFDPAMPVYDPKNREETMQYRIPALSADGKQKTRIRKGKGTEYL